MKTRACVLPKIELSPSEVDTLKQLEIQILKEIIRVCDSAKIGYFAAFGTLLGTIRHQGFIPWDDDIDVGMLFSDYIHFCKAWDQYADKDHFFLQTFETDKNYPLYFAKVRLRGTVYMQYEFQHHEMNQGVWVDIFPFFHIPEDRKKWKKMSRTIYLPFIKDKLQHRDLMTVSEKKDWRTRLYAIITIFSNEQHLLKKNMKLIDSWDRKYQKSSLVSGGNTLIPMPAVCFKDFIVGSFEGVSVAIPKDSDMVLRSHYGDYWKLPPVENRVPVHNVCQFAPLKPAAK
jgi:lipopolysaccharide cholinephosphotransferase